MRRLGPATQSVPIAVLALLLTSLTGGAAEVSGSQAILNACWSAEQLSGTDQDRRVTELGSRSLYNREPPARKRPTEPALPLPAGLHGSIRRVNLPPGDQRIALTFDLCEMASDVTGYDAALVNYLRAHRVPATFYAGGKWMRSHPEQTKQLMADPLFELGNHAWTHGNLHYLSAAEAADQVLWTQAQYELLREELAASACVRRLPTEEIERIPRRLASFRFPFGTCNQGALDLLAAAGLPAVQWDVLTGDPTQGTSAARIAARILQQTRPGSIIIAHANGRGWHTAAALDRFIPRLEQQGYAFVTVSELLAAGDAQRADSCFWEQPGDADYIDRRYGGGTEKPWPFR